MNQQYYPRLLRLAFLVSVLFVLVFTIITYKSLQNTTRISDGNKITLTILKQFELALNDLSRFEKDYRAYILSGNSFYLPKIQKGIDDYNYHVLQIDKAGVTNTEELKDIQLFKRLADSKISLGKRKVEAFKTGGKNAVTDGVFTIQGQILMDSIQFVGDKIENFERANLLEFDKQKLSSAKITFALIFAFSFLALLLFAGFALAVKKNLQKRVAAETALKELNTELEMRVAQRTRELSDYKYALDEAAIVGITDAQGIIKYANDNFCRISKCKREELIGKDHRMVNSGYHSAEFMRNLWQTISSGNIWHGEIKNRAKDGSYYWAGTTIVPFLDEERKPYQYLCIRQDITERKKAEEELTRSEARLNEAQTIARIGNWDNDLVNRIEEWSDETYNLYGYRKGEIKPGEKSFLERIHPDDMAHVKQKLASAFKTHTNSSVNYRFIRKDGEVRYGYSEAKFEFDNYRRPIRVYGIMMDVTEKKKADEEIRSLNENLELRISERTAELQQANKALEAFSYSVSHDLKAPVRAISGFTKIIEKEYFGQFNDDLKELFEHINSSSKRMHAIIEDLLTLAKYEKVKLQPQMVDMEQLFKTVLDNLTLYTPHNATVHINQLPTTLADPSLMEQVVVNLLSNAIKYSSKKEQPVITISCEQNNGFYTYSVKDNGAGFDMKNYHRLFGAFQRLHGSNEFEGTGVGLLLVKQIVEKHGGSIWAESKLGEGTTFYFSIPASEKKESRPYPERLSQTPNFYAM